MEESPLPDHCGSHPPRSTHPPDLPIRWVLLAFAVIELAYFLPMVWGWYPVPIHLFSPKFTGVSYQRTLPPRLTHLQSSDPTGVMMDFPNEVYTFARIRHGELPWWNPEIGCGRPWIGNAQVHPFSPLLLPLLIHPSPWSFSLQFVLGSLACLFGSFWFFRQLGFERSLALIGSALWTWNPFTAICMQMSSVWAYWWMPWAFCGIALALRRGRFSGWVVAGCAFALMALCGQPETALWLAYLSIFLLGTLWLAGQPPRIRPRWVMGGGLVMILLAIALSAAQWGPIFEVLADASWYKSKGLPPGYDAASIWSLFGPPNQVFLLPSLCGLALFAFRPKCFVAAGFSLMFLFCLCLCVPALFESPPLRLLRAGGIIPAFHGAELACVPLTALAVFGLAALRGGTGREPGPILRRSALAIAGVLTAVALFQLAPFGEGRWIPALWLLLGLVSFWAVSQRKGGASRPVFLFALALSSVAYPLAATQFQYPDFGGSPLPAWQAFLKQPPIELGHPPPRFWAQSSPRTRAPYLLPNLNLLCGVYDVRGATVINPPGSAAFCAEWGPKGHLSDLSHTLGQAPPPLLRFLGVDRVVISSPSEQTLFQVLPIQPGPRAFLVPDVSWLQTEKECLDRFKALLAEGTLERNAVALGNPPVAARLPVPGAIPGEWRVTWREYQPERMRLDVSCPSPCLLVVTDTLNRCWKASIDGYPTPMLRADVMFRGVWLSAGRHQVTMEFNRAGMMPYLVTSLLTWSAVGAAFFWWLVLRRGRLFPPGGGGDTGPWDYSGSRRPVRMKDEAQVGGHDMGEHE
jgi:hypothetical protein